MGVNGYSEKLVELDDRMVALGRPPPPVVSWLSGGLKGDIRVRHMAWLEQVRVWEETSPDAAVDWLELREQYRVAEELEEERKWNPDEFHYRLLERLGAPRTSIDVIRRTFDDRSCMKRSREWMLEGTWSLTLCGGPGSGKTTAATWAAHQLMMRRFRPYWVRCTAMVDAPMFGNEAQLVKHRCREAGVLVLDDIGAGARERDAKPWLGWLDDVLDSRWAAKKRTIITSNMAPGALSTWLGMRLADRLNEGVIHATTEKSMRGKSTQSQGVAQ